MAEFKWDKWQEEVLNYEGNITIRSGRQVGKSEVISAKSAKFAKEHPGTITLVIAASQRQSSLLFDKIKAQIYEDKSLSFAEEPTLTKIILTNGSKIYSLPAGRTGYFIRGFTIDLLIADEAAYIPEEVWKAVIPMIAVSKQMRSLGHIILLSTPFGKGGYYYNSFTDDDFRQFHISSEKCDRIPKTFLQKEKQRLTKQEYAQEYLGEFTEAWNQFFATELIKKAMTFIDWDYEKDYKKVNKYYLGVDVARYGEDENAFVIAEVNPNDKLRIIKTITTQRVSLSETEGRIKKLDEMFNFRKVFIDDNGVGGGLLDSLEETFHRRVKGLNNAQKSENAQGKRNKLLKEDLYSDVLMMLEQGKIEMISDLALLRSMKSITFQYTSEKNLKLFGDYSHLTEALTRACYCMKEKGLNLRLA